MSYHPVFGIVFFFLCLFFAYFLGRQSSIFKKKPYASKSYNKKSMHDFIAPDASWLNEKNKSDN